jgi:trans-aconitate methyltransferase
MKTEPTGKIDKDSGDPKKTDRCKQLYDMISPFMPQKAIILDLGCGTGWVADLFKPAKYTGIDTWSEQQKENKKRLPRYIWITDDAINYHPSSEINVLFELGANTYYGIEGKDNSHVNLCRNVELVAIETPTFFPLDRHQRLKDLYLANGYHIALEKTITVKKGTFRKERLLTVLKISNIK